MSIFFMTFLFIPPIAKASSSPNSTMQMKNPSLEYIFADLTTYSIPSPSEEPKPSLSTLPIELYSLIIPYLPYPDALSLKHTSRRFYSLTDTSIKLKVAWLIDRHSRGLPCPQKKCILKTDAAFCSSSGGEVRKIMERRRRHEECGSVCEVVQNTNCFQGQRRITLGKRGLRIDCMCNKGEIDPRLIGLALLILAISILVNAHAAISVYWR